MSVREKVNVFLAVLTRLTYSLGVSSFVVRFGGRHQAALRLCGIALTSCGPPLACHAAAFG